MYSFDIKKLCLNHYSSNNITIYDTSALFKVSIRSFYYWKANKHFIKLPHNRISKITPTIKCYIRAYVLRIKTIDILRLINILYNKFEVVISQSYMYDILKKLNFTYKNVHNKVICNHKSFHNKNVRKFIYKCNSFDQNKLVSIDESSFNTLMIPTKGWYKKGHKLVKYTKSSTKRIRYSLLCAISNDKILLFKLFKGSINSTQFCSFMSEFNKKYKNRHIIIDNASIHKTIKVRQIMKISSNELLFNVPYNSESNPIEMLFNQLKCYVRKDFPNNEKKLIRSIKKHLKNIPSTSLYNYFTHVLNMK